MDNSKLASFISERIRNIFNLSLNSLYNIKDFHVSLLFISKSSRKAENFYSHIYNNLVIEINKFISQNKIFPSSNDFKDTVSSFFYKKIKNSSFYNISLPPLETASWTVFPIVSISKKKYDSIYKIKRSSFFNVTHPSSLFDSIVEQIRHNVSFFEVTDRADGKFHYNPENIINEGVYKFVEIAAIASGSPAQGLLKHINNIANLTYEGKKGSGKIIFCNSDRFSMKIDLKYPIRLSESRKVRKLLEMTNASYGLLTDGRRVYGFGEALPQSEAYTVEIYDQCCWQFYHNGHFLLRSEFNTISITQRDVDRSLLADNIERLFKAGEHVDKFYALVRALVKSRHGTIVVITEGAKPESQRLYKNGFLPKTFTLDAGLLSQVTKIDGAVIIDPELNCHSFGIILDGISVANPDSSRGSRYNSALRYYTHIKETYSNSLVVVTSDDGMIDFIPPLLPRIEKRLLLRQIDNLKRCIANDKIDYETWYRSIAVLNEYREYFTKELCLLVNPIIRKKLELEGKEDDYDMLLFPYYSDLVKNELFQVAEYIDDTYFL